MATKDPGDWTRYFADKYISGVSGVLSHREQGVYWLICSLIMASGGPIEEDHARFAALGRGDRVSTTKRIIDRLVAVSKLYRSGTKLGQKRAESESQRALSRCESWRENGLKGGRPLKESNDLPKPGGFPEQNPIRNQLGGTEKRRESEESKDKKEFAADASNARAGEVSVGSVGTLFDAFWKLYPNRIGRAASVVSFAKALRRATPEIIMAGLARYIAQKPRDRPWCNPTTWLNQDRWLDEPDLLPPDGEPDGPRPPQRHDGESANLRAARRVFAELHGSDPDGGDAAAQPLLGRDDVGG